MDGRADRRTNSQAVSWWACVCVMAGTSVESLCMTGLKPRSTCSYVSRGCQPRRKAVHLTKRSLLQHTRRRWVFTTCSRSTRSGTSSLSQTAALCTVSARSIVKGQMYWCAPSVECLFTLRCVFYVQPSDFHRHSFAVSAPAVWNNIPAAVRDSVS